MRWVRKDCTQWIYNTVGFFFFFWMKVVTGDISDEEMAMFLNICICESQRLNIKQISYIHQSHSGIGKFPCLKENRCVSGTCQFSKGCINIRITERPQELYILWSNEQRILTTFHPWKHWKQKLNIGKRQIISADENPSSIHSVKGSLPNELTPYCFHYSKFLLRAASKMYIQVLLSV